VRQPYKRNVFMGVTRIMGPGVDATVQHLSECPGLMVACLNQAYREGYVNAEANNRKAMRRAVRHARKATEDFERAREIEAKRWFLHANRHLKGTEPK
jgi:hypothetical protein